MQPIHGADEVSFKSTVRWADEHAEALVIHCSDGRFQAHFDDFLANGLHLESFDRVVVPGGPQFLLAAAFLPKFEWAGRRWVKFLAKHHSTRRIICIGHDDCAWYKDLTVGSYTIPLLKQRQIDDLHKARAALLEMFPSVAVELYFAHPSHDGKVEFAMLTD